MRKKKIDGEKIRALREYQWLTLEQVGKRAGVALHTVNRIETGHTPYPQAHTILGIAKVLGVDPHDLLQE